MHHGIGVPAIENPHEKGIGVSGPEIDFYSDAAEGDRMGDTGNLKYGTERRCPA